MTETDTESYSESTSSDELVDQADNIDFTFKILNNYNVIYEIGRGSYSIVWLAYNICNNNFYALKVQDPNEYKEGKAEIDFVKKLPSSPPLFTNLFEAFSFEKGKKRYLCSAWYLHSSNIDSLIRKEIYKPNLALVKHIMRQLIEAVYILHTKLKVTHCDIKTDNILLKGVNKKNEFIINKYREANFFQQYSSKKKEFWLQKGKTLESIDKMKKEDKLRIRNEIHSSICKNIFAKLKETPINSNEIDEKYLNNFSISLGDFGSHCDEDTYYEESFGTRYYQAPEIILMGKCSYPVDVWALGCVFFELLTGELLFDPIKDKDHSRDYYHLCLINETCGNFNKDWLQSTKFAKKFFTKNGSIKDFNRTEDRLERKLDCNFLTNQEKSQVKEILLKMVTINPRNRITVSELRCLQFWEI